MSNTISPFDIDAFRIGKLAGTRNGAYILEIANEVELEDNAYLEVVVSPVTNSEKKLTWYRNTQGLETFKAGPLDIVMWATENT